MEASKMLSMLSDPTYLEYLDIIKKNGDMALLCIDGKILINGYTLTPPVMVNIYTKLDELREEKTELYKQYHNLYDLILKSENPNTFKKEYDNIIDKINDIEKSENSILLYHKTANENSEVFRLADSVEQLKLDREAIFEQNKEAVVISKEDIEQIMTINAKIADMQKKLSQNKNSAKIDYYLSTLPVIERKGKEKKQTEEKKSSKPKYKSVNDAQAEEIKSNVKSLIRKTFKFTSFEECASQKRSLKTFMSKDQILTEIDKNDRIKNGLPLGYKKFKKNELCKAIFSIK